MNVIHATALALAVDPDGPLAGVLLLGVSGSGKTALAVAAIESCPWRRSLLVADDAPILEAKDGVCSAKSPPKISGLVELRGFGPVRVRTAPQTEIRAAFEINSDGSRMPEPLIRTLAPGVEIEVWPFRTGPDAAFRLRLAVRSILSGQARPGAHHAAGSSQ